MKLTFHVEYTFLVSCSVFEILKQNAFYTVCRQYAPEALDYMDLVSCLVWLLHRH